MSTRYEAQDGGASSLSTRHRRSSPGILGPDIDGQTTQSSQHVVTPSSSGNSAAARRKEQAYRGEHKIAGLSSEEEEDNTDADEHTPSSTSSPFDGTDDEVSNSKHRHRHQHPLTTTTTSSQKPYTPNEERKVLHKLDRRLTLFLSFLYLLSFLDRSNIGNAKIAGLQTSLSITDSQFDLTLLAFYVTYITFEWMILLYRLVPAHIYISGCVFAWGLVACLQSVVTSFRQLLGLRALLGVTEAAFGPGVPFYMTFFYRREELAYRVGLQISAAPLATSFASSLAYVIVRLSEGGPLESWRALFLFEGFPSLVVAVFAWYFVPDGPGSASWLNEREREVAVARLQGEKGVVYDEDDKTNKDQGDGLSLFSSSSKSNQKLRQMSSKTGLVRADLLATLLDPKSYMTALMFLSVNVSFASLPVFLPTIINSMSFSPLTSQILSAPPYLLSFFFVLLVGRASDRIPNSRSIFLACSAGLSCVSYTIIAVVGSLQHDHVDSSRSSIVVRYVALYGVACGLFASVVLIITWTLNNQRSSTGKGMGMVILNVVGQCGPLIGVQLFPGRDGPVYVKGMAVCAGFMGVVVVLALSLRGYLARLNGRKIGGVERRGDGFGGYQMVRLGGRSGGDEGGEDDEEDAEGEGEEARTMLVGENEDDDRVRQRHRQDFTYML